MRGIPRVYNTKQDWLNTHDYVMAGGDDGLKTALTCRLQALKECGTTMVLKDGVVKPPDEQTPADYEPAADAASSLSRSGLSTAEIDLMISQQGGA